MVMGGTCNKGVEIRTVYLKRSGNDSMVWSIDGATAYITLDLSGVDNEAKCHPGLETMYQSKGSGT